MDINVLSKSAGSGLTELVEKQATWSVGLKLPEFSITTIESHGNTTHDSTF